MTDWIVAISSAIAAFGILFLAMQVKLSIRQIALMEMQMQLVQKQMEADHERSRRERALDVLKHWTESVSVSQPSARLLVEGFSHKECEKLIAHKSFTIHKDNFDLLRIALNDFSDCDEPKIEGENIRLEADHIFLIGQQCSSFLNSLEIAVQAWLNNVADTDILEAELKYLVKPEKKYFVLQEFRDALGGINTYPAIQAFVDHIKSMEPTASGKDRVA